MPSPKTAPAAAILAVFAAFACCIPLGFIGALGVFLIGAMFESLQSWFIAAAVLLFAIAAIQSFRGQRTCTRKASRFSLIVLALSATVIAGVLLFPQTLAALLADTL